MGMANQLSDRFERVTGEHVLLLAFGGTALYMVISANQWGFNSRVFPQLIGSLLLVGVVLLFVREYLPEPLYTLVAESAAAFEETEETETAGEEPGDRELDRPGDPVTATAAFIAAYGVVGYLFSLLIATPLFVIAYMYWFRQEWYMILFLTLLSIALAYGFADVVNAPVDDGQIVDGLLG